MGVNTLVKRFENKGEPQTAINVPGENYTAFVPCFILYWNCTLAPCPWRDKMGGYILCIIATNLRTAQLTLQKNPFHGRKSCALLSRWGRSRILIFHMDTVSLLIYTVFLFTLAAETLLAKPTAHLQRHPRCWVCSVPHRLYPAFFPHWMLFSPGPTCFSANLVTEGTAESQLLPLRRCSRDHC